jgi:hypothetical protein
LWTPRLSNLLLLIFAAPRAAPRAKKQQMRWTDEGAHVVALVRVADLNGELSADAFGQVTRPRRSAIDRFWAEPMSLAA